MSFERGQYNPPPTDQLLSKLAWLQGRSQPDFKGHVPKADVKLTAGVVKERKEAEIRKRVGADNFLPFQNASNKYVNMRFDATKSTIRRVEGSENIRPDTLSGARMAPTHPNNNIYRQELDPNTGRPAINTVLSYNDGEFVPQARPTGRRVFADRNGSGNIFLRAESSHVGGSRPSMDDVRNGSADHRLDVLRADLMRHPMFTQDSKIAHSTTYWDPMTQLMGHQYMVPPPRKERPTLQQKRNPVRMVEVMRRSQSARPWH